MNLVILTGMPATGKSTAAAALSRALGYPILEKDAMKEALFDTLGFTCYKEKRALDHGANAVLLRTLEAMLTAGTSVIVDNNFDEKSAGELAALLARFAVSCVTVFLDGDPHVLYERYVAREAAQQRHPGHALQEHYPPREGDNLQYTMTRDEFNEKFFGRGMAKFPSIGERIDVDTTSFSAVSLEALCARVKSLLEP